MKPLLMLNNNKFITLIKVYQFYMIKSMNNTSKFSFEHINSNISS
jgi:hypothetical protein